MTIGDRDRLARTIGLAMRATGDRPPTDAERARIATVVLDRVTAIARAQASGQLPKRTLDLAHICIDPYDPDRTVWQNYCDLFRALESGCAALNIPKFPGALFAYDRAISESVWLPDWVCQKLRAYAGAIEHDTIELRLADPNASP